MFSCTFFFLQFIYEIKLLAAVKECVLLYFMMQNQIKCVKEQSNWQLRISWSKNNCWGEKMKQKGTESYEGDEQVRNMLCQNFICVNNTIAGKSK
jgi:hypothetical protein